MNLSTQWAVGPLAKEAYVCSPQTFLTDFDLLFRDLFDNSSFFTTLPALKKINYPVDIKETKTGVEIDITAVGLEKSDIKIDIVDRVLTVSYTKTENLEQDKEYLYKGITKKSFNHAWRIGDKYDITKVEANLDKGLLKVRIPVAPEKQPKQIEVKIN